MIWYMLMTALILVVVYYLFEKDTQKPMKIKEILYYPLVSCRGIHMWVSDLCLKGFPRDSEWVIAYDSKELITADTDYRLLDIQPSFLFDGNDLPEFLVLSYKRSENLQLRLGASEGSRIEIRGVAYVDEGEEAAQWLNKALNAPYRLLKRTEDPQEGILKIAIVEAFSEVFSWQKALSVDIPHILKYHPHLVVQNCDLKDVLSWKSVKVGNTTLEVIGLWNLSDSVYRYANVDEFRDEDSNGIRHQGILGILCKICTEGTIKHNSRVEVLDFQRSMFFNNVLY